MSEKNDISIEEASKNEKNSVGEILRNKRISMNLSIEKLSKDLRIGKAYIEAIEENKFDLIPAPTYVRVYVKTIAEHLKLDAAALLKQLYKENSKIAGMQAKEKQFEEEKPLNVKVSEQSKNGKFGLIVLLLILLVVLIFVVSQNDNLNNGEIIIVEDTDKSSEIITQEPDDFENLPSDSSMRGDTIITEDSAAVVAAIPAPEKIELTLKVVKSNSWVEIFADGKVSQKGEIIHAPSQIIIATAVDSINVRAGKQEVVEISVNGKRIDQTGTSGIWTFTKDGARNLTPAQWERIKNAAEKKVTH